MERGAPVTAELPIALADLARGVLGALMRVADRSWPRTASRVWQVYGRNGTVYVKQHQSPKFHGREVTAYRTWVPALGDAAPRLLADDPTHLAVVVTAVGGAPAKLSPLTLSQEVDVHARAGALARQIHEALPPFASAPALPASYVAKHLERTQITGPALDRARAILADAARVTLPQVATHGDYQPRNWLYGDGKTLRTVDFERAEPAAAVRDFRLLVAGAWLDRPDLRAAFLAGYGRNLNAAEERALAGWVVLDAIDSVRWGRLHGDAEVEARGLAGLARLRDGP